MYISLNPIQYFDLAGVPLVAGRLRIYLHGSNNLASTYVMDGTRFIAGPNPVMLDNSGEQPNTIFLEAAIYDIHVDKNVDGTFTKISDFQFGFELPDVKNDTVVDGVAGLAQANPELGTVTVVGYDSNVFCGARSYIWDAGCTDAADGGCIVASQTTDTGRWLLLSDLREMPCTYYGVVPGHEANMSAFLTYPSVVGTYGIWMPPVPRFLKGDYASTGTFTTSKTVSFDAGARLTACKLQCNSVEITEPLESYVGDFVFAAQPVAESRWFRSAKAFWNCGAEELHQSPANYFADSNIGSAGQVGATLSRQKITGRPMAMTGSALLDFTLCEFAERSLSLDWYVNFHTCVITDRWFLGSVWDVGNSYANKQKIDITDNSVVLSNFDSADVYLKIVVGNGLDSVDLENRFVQSITADMGLRNLGHAYVNEAHFDSDIQMSDVVITDLYLDGGTGRADLTRVTATLKDTDFANINAHDSTLTFEADVDTATTALNMERSTLGFGSHNVGPESGQVGTTVNSVIFLDCNVSDAKVYTNQPWVSDCTLHNVGFVVYPIKSGSAYTYSIDFRRNRFLNASYITMSATAGETTPDATVYECGIGHLAIVDNEFNTTVSGVNCPFWAADGQHRFMAGIVYDITLSGGVYAVLWQSSYEYRGNTGNCPLSYFTQATLVNGGTDVSIAGKFSGTVTQYDDTVKVPTGGDTLHGRINQRVFCMPVTLSDWGTDEGSVHTIDNAAKLCTPYNGLYKDLGVFNTEAAPGLPSYWLVPNGAWDQSLPNDMFSVRLAVQAGLDGAGAVGMYNAQ